jgi:hypothetical protein
MNYLDHFDHEDKKQDKQHFMHLIQVALADGKIDQKESEMLHRFGRKRGFTNPEIDIPLMNLLSGLNRFMIL